MDNQRATLKDVINYSPDQYLSDEEITLIRNTFRYNPILLNVLRKILVPTVSDKELPIESLDSDFFLQGRNWSQIPAEEAKIMIVAREDALRFIMGGLIKLKVIANQTEETLEQKKLRRQKDSAQ